jgi:orotate phosphoribosyltransferase-like protein
MAISGRVWNYAQDGMTFEEIGRELGITPQGAMSLYKSAMWKIRKANNRKILLQWAELVIERRKIRNGESSI